VNTVRFFKGVRASVRMRDIYLEISGEIPGELLQFLRDYYGRRLILRNYCEPMRDVLNAPLYKRVPLKMKPGDCLRFFRQDNGLSQSELCRKLGRLSRQDLSKMENGRRPISRRMALRLAGFFDVSVDKFIGEEYPASGGPCDQS
jgi:DNA-binding XRE family transcriptional regulator